MTNKSRPYKGMFRLVAAIAVAIVVPVIARPAMAAGTSGTLSHVQYIYVGTNAALQVNFDNGTVVIAQQPTPGCSIAANSLDTVKVFQELALQALASAKSVNASYTFCSATGSNYLTGIDVVR